MLDVKDAKTKKNSCCDLSDIWEAEQKREREGERERGKEGERQGEGRKSKARFEM